MNRHTIGRSALLAGIVAGRGRRCRRPQAPPPTIPGFLAAAVADPARPAADVERDANRKPAETLLFAGHRTRMQGRGAVAGRRLLHAHHQQGGGRAPAMCMRSCPRRVRTRRPMPPISRRGSRRSRPTPTIPMSAWWSSRSRELKTPEPVDLVWTSQNYHDLHNFPGLNLTVFNQMVFEALKPGRHLSHPGSFLGAGGRQRASPRLCIESTRRRSNRRCSRRDSNSSAAAICCTGPRIRAPRRCSIPRSAAAPINSS